MSWYVHYHKKRLYVFAAQGENLECLPKLPTDQLFHRQMRNILIHAPPSNNVIRSIYENLNVWQIVRRVNNYLGRTTDSKS